MLRKSLAFTCYICDECGSVMVVKQASEGIPAACQKCGTPRDVSLSEDQRKAIRNQQQGPRMQQDPRIQRSGNSYTIRF